MFFETQAIINPEESIERSFSLFKLKPKFDGFDNLEEILEYSD